MKSNDKKGHDKHKNIQQKSKFYEQNRSDTPDKADSIIKLMDEDICQNIMRLDQSKHFHQTALIGNPLVPSSFYPIQVLENQSKNESYNKPFMDKHTVNAMIKNQEQLKGKKDEADSTSGMSDVKLQRTIHQQSQQKKIKQKQKREAATQDDKDLLSYEQKINKMNKSAHLQDEENLDRMEKDLLDNDDVFRKWQGTGLEDEIYQEYMAPTTQPISHRNLDQPESRVYDSETNQQLTKKQPLFEKDLPKKEELFKQRQTHYVQQEVNQIKVQPKLVQYLTLDGMVTEQASVQKTSGYMQVMRQYSKENYRNKHFSLSRYFQLKIASQYKGVSDKKVGNDIIKLIPSGYKGQLNFTEQTTRKNTIKGQNTQKVSEMQEEIPTAKEWFTSLDQKERAFCLSTVDADLVQSLKLMQQELLKVSRQEQGKFRMNSRLEYVSDGKYHHDKIKIKHNYNLMNSQAHRSSYEVMQAELEFMSYVRITDTLLMHDTLTVSEELVKNPGKFFELAGDIVGQNFLICPLEIVWVTDETYYQNQFSVSAPLWFNMQDPNSLAAWILFYFERAIFTQYQINVYKNFLDCKDSNNVSIYLSTENKNIVLKDELRPFWRSYCDNIQSHKESPDELLQQIKSKAITVFDIKSPEQQTHEEQIISSLHGGLADYDVKSQNSMLFEQIDKFLAKLEKCIENNNTKEEPQLQLNVLCFNTLKEASFLTSPMDGKKIAEEFFVASLSNSSSYSRIQQTISLGGQKILAQHELNVQQKLERIFIEVFRDKVNKELKSNFTSQNKKLQKRKIKKLKQKEQELENQRELQKQQEMQQQKQEETVNVIKVQSANAIELLLGKQIETDNVEVEWSQEQTDQIKNKKKNKNKKKSKNEDIKQEKIVQSDQQQTKLSVSIEDIQPIVMPVKPTTPVQNKLLKQNVMSQNKIDPQNYFQVMDHKYAVSLASQGQTTKSNISSEISGLFSYVTMQELHNKGITTYTKSTSEESKKTINDTAEVTRISEQATSNQEILQHQQNYYGQGQGNQMINNTQWQRRQQHELNDMINELVNEPSEGTGQPFVRKPERIGIKIKLNENKLEADLESDHQEILGSSESSINSKKRILTFKPRPNTRVIPKQRKPSNSDDTSDADSDIELLPDLHTTNIQPKDNDSSAYEQEDDESLDEEDESSVAYSNSQNVKNIKRQLYPKQNRRTPGKGGKRHSANHSTKKSIKSANIKSGGNVINFYPQENVDVIIEPEVIKCKWKPLHRVEPITIQYIVKEKELTLDWKENKKKNKKQVKKEKEAAKKAEEHKKEEVIEPKTIQIIKPTIEVIKPTPYKETQQKQQDQTEKKQKQKKNQVESMDEFMSKMLKVNKDPLPEIKKLPEAKPIIPEKKIEKPVPKVEEVKSEPPKDIKDVKTTKPPVSNTPAPVSQSAGQKYVKKSSINDQRSERMSTQEEAKALSTGFEYKAKKTQPTSSSQEHISEKDKPSEQAVTQTKDKVNSSSPSRKQAVVQKGNKDSAPEQKNQSQNQNQKKQDEKATNDKKTQETNKNDKKKEQQQESIERKSPQKQQHVQEMKEVKAKIEIQEEEKKVSSTTNSPQKTAPPTVKKTDLNINSKEYKMPENLPMMHYEDEYDQKMMSLSDNEQNNNTADQPKKKQKKKRSNKAKKKIQNQLLFDPAFGQQLLSMSLMDGRFDPNFNSQVQTLIQTLNEQVLAQQQQQMMEYQQRQQQEAENQLKEECEPCEELNPEKYQKFFDLLEEEMRNKIKEIDMLKDSVRKERQGFIQIMEHIVKDTFQNKYGNGYVGLKMFGSMATELAIETSDVDLVVTGINQGGHGYRNEYAGKAQLLRMMQILHDNLQALKTEKKIQSIKFIQSASVPIIKLEVDLQVINQWQIETRLYELKQERIANQEFNEEIENEKIDLKQMGLSKKNIDPKVRILKVDISIDEQSESFQKLKQFDYFPSPLKTHSGIDTIYHIQELVHQRKDLRPIVMIIKKIFDGTFLSMPYYGGISSFSLVLMVSAYLKRFDADKQESLSTNLSGFFHFYGVGFKPHLFYLNGDQIEFCQDPEARPFTDPFIVLDPLDPSNNISHCTFRIRDIQKALVQAFKIINKSCEQFQEVPDNESCQPKQVLERLINEIQQSYKFRATYYDD